VLGPYRVPAEVEPAPAEIALPLVPARREQEPDELAPVERAYHGRAPIDQAEADRLAARSVASFVIIAVWMGLSVIVVLTNRP
jgi:hypothetical protein